MGRSIMASGATRVAEGPAFLGSEPPLGALRAQGYLQHAVGIIAVDLAVGDWLQDGVVALAAAGAHHELPDAALGVCLTDRVLRGEAFVVVLVAGEDHLGPPFVEGLPQRLYVVGVAVFFPRAEARMVHVGQRAPLVFVGGEVRLEPAHLLRGFLAVTDLLLLAVAV